MHDLKDREFLQQALDKKLIKLGFEESKLAPAYAFSLFRSLHQADIEFPGDLISLGNYIRDHDGMSVSVIVFNYDVQVIYSKSPHSNIGLGKFEAYEFLDLANPFADKISLTSNQSIGKDDDTSALRTVADRPLDVPAAKEPR